jgi:type II secretory ATPase GspE/PulE/Tfp pilus assembly ATPase PilB-like protein
MTKDLQSVEDLISDSHGDSIDERSSMAAFHRKQAQLKIQDEERMIEARANTLGLMYDNLFGKPIGSDALTFIKEEEARRINLVCFYFDGKNIRFATTDPGRPEVFEVMERVSQVNYAEAKLYLVSERSMEFCLSLYSTLPNVRKFIRGLEIKEEDILKLEVDIRNYKTIADKVHTVNMTEVITTLLAGALKLGASDLHIEAEEQAIAARYRIDGVLYDVAKLGKDQWRKIISRLKLLARVKLNIDDKPQDGRFSIFLRDEKIEVRVSFLPTAYGESVVMRLLKQSSIGLPFEELGILPGAFKILSSEIKKPNGMILTTGPTGSGKTTTLYAVLRKLNTSDIKIVTLEDPIEYQLEGISQSQVDPSKDYTFAKGLRSILRQDPDIVMVGEIRDLETAEIAIQAALTGHLVLSTLHTNDSSGVIPRLIDMGVRPYFLSPSINAIIGQRLVRKLCPDCCVEHVLTSPEKEQLEKILSVISPKASIDIPVHLPKLYKAGPGCASCGELGYKGRIGIYEIFSMTDSIKSLVSEQSAAFKILQQAMEEGMITMLQDGVLKVLQGTTSLEEVYRVIGKFDYIDSLYDIVIQDIIGRGITISAEDIAEGEKLAAKVMNIREILSTMSTDRLIYVLMATAINSMAGDVHIEPNEKGASVRFRIDGIMHDITVISKEQYLQVLSKIKVSAGFPTNVKRAHWDGRFSLIMEGVRKDSRISIISGAYGETIVLRLYMTQAAALKLDELGIKDYTLAPLKRSIDRVQGIIVTTGPTGAGKTTTLYSILNQLNSPDIKLITIEDPIEYHLDGIMQTQVDIDGGYTFTEALKFLLRQNPNIIMVGEIRDPETAKVAIEAALTGHLVLSTIHASSAASAISRFSGLGVDRQTLANALNSTIGQRLVRKICPYCKVEEQLDAKIMEEVEGIISKMNPEVTATLPKERKFYKGAGCEHCGGIGYKGRVGIYETIEMQPEIKRLMQEPRVTDEMIEEMAIAKGTVLMLQDGIIKALEGETSVGEVFRVIR